MPSNAPLKKADIKVHNNVICNRSQIYIPLSLSCIFMVLKFHIFLFARLQINRCGGIKKPCQDVMDYQVLLRIEGNKTPQQQMIRLTALTLPTWGWVGAVNFFSIIFRQAPRCLATYRQCVVILHFGKKEVKWEIPRGN